MPNPTFSSTPAGAGAPEPAVPKHLDDDALREELDRRAEERRIAHKQAEQEAAALRQARHDADQLAAELNKSLDKVRADLLKWHDVGKLHARQEAALAAYLASIERIIGVFTGLVSYRYLPARHPLTRAVELLRQLAD